MLIIKITFTATRIVTVKMIKTSWTLIFYDCNPVYLGG
jgi:hypothetical protein